MNACPARGGRFCCCLCGEGAGISKFKIQNSKFKMQNAECTPKVCFLTVRYEVRE